MKSISLMTFITLFLAACTSTSNETKVTTKQPLEPVKKVATAPVQYCQSMGGVVKTVGSGKDSFCILPGGEVVKLQTFYDNNH